MKQLSLLLFNLIFIWGFSYAQESECNVSMISIIGTYTGECLRGKANGFGKAVGTDMYEGEFKVGYPDGEGTYTWANGSTYTGSFKKGKMDGKGKMNLKTGTGEVSLLVGFWKKDKYIGEYEFPHKVQDQSNNVVRVNVSIIDKGDKTGNINITSSQAISSASGPNNAVPFIAEINVISGQYISKTSSIITKTSVMRLQQMIFPFRARFIYNTGHVFEAIFNEKGNYEVNVNLQ